MNPLFDDAAYRLASIIEEGSGRGKHERRHGLYRLVVCQGLAIFQLRQLVLTIILLLRIVRVRRTVRRMKTIMGDGESHSHYE